MKGSANCCLDHVEWLRRSGPTKKYGDWIKIAAVERREARVLDRKSTRRLSRGVYLLPKRRPGAPLPRACEGEEKRGTAPRLAHNRGRWRTPAGLCKTSPQQRETKDTQ